MIPAIVTIVLTVVLLVFMPGVSYLIAVGYGGYLFSKWMAKI